MDAALRQRLIGAAVLILLAVVFVPMLLDGPPTQGDAQEVPLDIPDRPMETRRLPINPNDLPPADPAPTASAPLLTADGGSAQVAPLDGAPPAAAPSEGPAPIVRTEPPAATQAPVPTEVVDAPGGRYVVRFGSFGDRANADRLVARLKTAGVPATVEPVSSGDRTLQRVRSQALADRTEAERIRLVARKALPEVSAQVVELDLPTVTSSRVANPIASGWAVQVGVFSTNETADKLAGQLQAGGYEGYVERLPSDGKVLYRVRIGPLARRADADRVLGEVKSKHKLDGLVVSYP